ncbi:Xrn1, helical domain [Dillenia turbinata]|uniref:Xrn1, helical domain n=1 Tax=Dillenia turbinata TaxID=194707 RepID=A0AAN8ZJ95_9MAGN
MLVENLHFLSGEGNSASCESAGGHLAFGSVVMILQNIMELKQELKDYLCKQGDLLRNGVFAVDKSNIHFTVDLLLLIFGAHALPDAFRALLTNVESKIINCYPKGEILKLINLFLSRGIIKLPFIEGKCPLAERQKLELELKAAERSCGRALSSQGKNSFSQSGGGAANYGWQHNAMATPVNYAWQHGSCRSAQAHGRVALILSFLDSVTMITSCLVLKKLGGVYSSVVNSDLDHNRIPAKQNLAIKYATFYVLSLIGYSSEDNECWLGHPVF